MLLFGCADRNRVMALGHWTGGFYTDRAEALRGYLHLYQTGDKFKLELANRVQGATLGGTWKLDKRRITLTITTIEFDNPTTEDQKSLGLNVVSPDSIRSAYANHVVLDLDPSGTTLTGLTMSIGPLKGRHQFTKGDVTPNAKKAIDRMGVK